MATDIQTLLRLRVPVIVLVGQRRVPMDDVLAFGPGTIFELERSAEEDLDLHVNNKPIGRGVAVKVGENFGIRLTSIGSRKERIEAMGS